MEPVITPRRTLRDGIAFTFSGIPPEDSGEQSDDLFEIELVVPPMNFDTLQRLDSKLFGEVGTQIEQMRTVVTGLELSLKRNYKDVPTWLIAQSVHLGNMESMFKALMDVSGLRRKAVEDEKKARVASLNGTTSMPTSSPPQDIPGKQ